MIAHRLACAALAVAAAFGAPASTVAQAARTHVVLVTGLGGDPEYADAFHDWALQIRQGAIESGVSADRILWLADEPERAPDVIRARSTKEELQSAIEHVARVAGADDRVLIALIGHGTFRRQRATFNLSGPDLSGEDLDALLAPLATQTVGIVNTSPSSGPFAEALAGPRRVVITATKTGRESNETQFGGFFAEALVGGAADLDKDNRISLLEAFRYATSEVTRYYADQNLLQTEHPILEDDADGRGSENPTASGRLFTAGPAGAPGEEEEEADGADGMLASGFWLGNRVGVVALGDTVTVVPDSITDPELRRLVQERIGLEQQVAALRARQGEMTAEAYEAELERLLLELALKNREIRAKGGGG